MGVGDWTVLGDPDWFWAGSPETIFTDAGLKSRRLPDGGWAVRTSESYLRQKPALIRACVYRGGGRPDRMDELSRFTERVEVSNLDFGRLQAEIDRLAARVDDRSEFVRVIEHAQAVLMVTPPDDLATNAKKIVEGIAEIEWPSNARGVGRPFESLGFAAVCTDPKFAMRMRLPSILVRLESDPRMRGGDLTHLSLDESGPVFSSSSGLYDGIYMLEPYLGPLRGALSPYMWCIGAPRTFGTLLIPLGQTIRGTSSDAGDPLQTIVSKSPKAPVPRPITSVVGQLDAIDWWGSALNSLFGVIGDPAVFRNREGKYQPREHLACLLTIEQLFRRVTSLLLLHRDVTARHALLFTCLDTLEGLTGRSLQKQFMASQAEKVLNRLSQEIPGSVHEVLLPTASRSSAALLSVQSGFALARQEGRSQLTWAGKTADLETSASYYLVALRNATHGHGGDKGTAAQKERDRTLLVQHDGDLPDDLPLLAYLYLLDLLADPARLRRILEQRSS